MHGDIHFGIGDRRPCSGRPVPRVVSRARGLPLCACQFNRMKVRAVFSLPKDVSEMPEPIRPNRRWASPAAAADHIGVTARTIRQMISDGRLTGYRSVQPGKSTSRLVRVDLNELDAAMKPFGGAA